MGGLFIRSPSLVPLYMWLLLPKMPQNGAKLILSKGSRPHSEDAIVGVKTKESSSELDHQCQRSVLRRIARMAGRTDYKVNQERPVLYFR